MNFEYCTCKNPYDGFLPLNSCGISVSVHGACMKPAKLYWQYHVVTCEECGKTFSSPSFASICEECCKLLTNLGIPFEPCEPPEGRTWAAAVEKYRRWFVEWVESDTAV